MTIFIVVSQLYDFFRFLLHLNLNCNSFYYYVSQLPSSGHLKII